MTDNTASIKISSLNVKGLSHPVKKRKILNYFSNKSPGILMLQETHISAQEALRLKTLWAQDVFCSAALGKKNGVVTIISKKAGLTCEFQASDLEGRWLLNHFRGTGLDVWILNIYAPTISEPGFWETLQKQLFLCPINGNLIIGGDFNMPLDPVLDKQSKVPFRPSKAHKAMKALINNLSLLDPWRLLHPTGCEFSFYSAPHASYSRIDYLLLSAPLLSRITASVIDPICISDHAAIHIVMALQALDSTPPKRWKLNDEIFSNRDGLHKIEATIKNYISENDTDEVSVVTLWDALKATTRGAIISVMAHANRSISSQLIALEKEIKILERRHINSAKPDLLLPLRKLKFQYNSLASKRAGIEVQEYKAKVFTSLNKSGKMLANYLKTKKISTRISAIRSKNGALLTTQDDISARFLAFYKDLYTPHSKASIPDIDAFLHGIVAPKLPPPTANLLGEPITELEITNAIKSMKSGKAPGPDGYSASFYKHFSSILSPVLLKTFRHFQSSGSVSGTMSDAMIIVFPKTDKDNSKVENYRPISLINFDAKVYAKILAVRLSQIIGNIIHPSQTGFLKGRLSSDNTRLFCDIIALGRSLDEAAVVVALDAEKAFDKVAWAFLQRSLHWFGFSEDAIRTVMALYDSPRACININGHISPFFTLGQGTRQGCPLSPLLFLIALEPLACLFRQSDDIKGLSLGDCSVKAALYADDIVLFLTDPERSIPAMLGAIKSYSEVSGYTLNTSKTEVMPINPHATKQCIPDPRLQWQPDQLKYLGIKFCPNLHDTREINVRMVLSTITDLTTRWSPKYITWWGRLDTIKMMITPVVNYTLAMLPLQMPASFFKSVKNILQTFLWSNKKPRISWIKLQASKDAGGVNLPDFVSYQEAFMLRAGTRWLSSTPRDTYCPAWVGLERAMMSPFPLDSIITMNNPPNTINNEVIQSTKEIMRGVDKKYFFNKLGCSTTQSPWHNRSFRINKHTVAWRRWIECNILQISDIWSTQGLLPFQELTDKFGLPNSEYLHYMQLKHAMTNTQFDASPMPLLQHCQIADKVGHSASYFYRFFRDIKMDVNRTRQQMWHDELSPALSEDQWRRVWAYAAKIMVAPNLTQTRYFLLHKAFWTPVKLHSAKLSMSDVCWHCKVSKGTYSHMFYSCTPIHTFWQEVGKLISTICHIVIPMSEPLVFLGSNTLTVPIQPYDSLLIDILIDIGIKTITCNWKSSKDINTHVWWGWVQFAKYAMVSSAQNDQSRLKKCEKIWTKVDNYVQLQ